MNSKTKGEKHDIGKDQWALLPWKQVRQVVQVLTFGAQKYQPNNWMHVPASERRYFEAAIRHIYARQTGEVLDKESRLPHLAHAICCLLFWMWFDDKNRKGRR